MKIIYIIRWQGGRFLLWWLFFNEKQSKVIGSQQDLPSDELLSYLAMSKTSIESFQVKAAIVICGKYVLPKQGEL